MKGSEHGEVSQRDLWNLTHEVERAIWATPNLGIPGVVQVIYLGNTTDLHLLEPFYFTRMDFEVLYYETLVREC